MPFCPQCRYEYEAGTVTCPDCDEQLVESLPEAGGAGAPESRSGRKDWVLIARLTSREYAEMVLEGLRAKDIPAVVHSATGHFGQTGQMGTSTFRPVGGGYSLMVSREHVAEADREAELILGDIWRQSRLIDLDRS
ncbi:MAG TPA: hypothetical protein VMY05_04815 [Acidobacteriota bacterium]|nr:hypothetical protein [Acidobacteriota bacterium]